MKLKHLPLNIDEANNRNHFYETLWKEVAFNLLSEHEKNLSGWTVLDYGCGRGESLKLAADLGMNPVGTDLEPECVQTASAHGETCLLDANNPLGQFGEKSFDVVTCFHVLEHVPCPVETLTALRRIARKYVILAVPNLSAFHDLLRPRKWLLPVNEGHLQSWDHAHFQNLAEVHCGLQIVDWGFDTVIVPPFSNLALRFFGRRSTIWLETKVFKKLHPYGSLSVIALAKPQ